MRGVFVIGAAVDALRTNYGMARWFWREIEGWSADDLAEVDAAVVAAVKVGDVELIESWQCVLRPTVLLLDELKNRARAFTVRVKAEAAERVAHDEQGTV